MLSQKQSNRPIKEIKQERCINCNEFINSSLIRTHQAICAVTISNKKQEMLDQQLAILIQQNNLESQIFLSQNPPHSIQSQTIQQEIQKKNKEVPTQNEQIISYYNPNSQQKEVTFRQEQKVFNDDSTIQKNELNYQRKLNSQDQVEKNVQYIDQKIQSNMVFNKVQSQTQPPNNLQNYPIQIPQSQDKAQRSYHVQAKIDNKSPKYPDIIIQDNRNEYIMHSCSNTRNKQIQKQSQTHIENQLDQNFVKNEEFIRQRQISEEKKLENDQFQKFNQFNYIHGINYDQFNKNNQLNQQSHQNKQQQQNVQQQNQHSNEKNQFSQHGQTFSFKKPRIFQQIQFEKNDYKALNFQQQQSQQQQQQQLQSQYSQQQQQPQQAQQLQQPQKLLQPQQLQQPQQTQQPQQPQQAQQLQQLQKPQQPQKLQQQQYNQKQQFQTQKQTHHQQNQKQQQQNHQNQNIQDNAQQIIVKQMKLEEKCHDQKDSINHKNEQHINKNQKQSQSQHQSRQEQNKKKESIVNKKKTNNEHRIIINQVQENVMRITDDMVNQMSPEEIYEYFTQLDQENQVGLISKISFLDLKRVQINEIDRCTICMDDIQPQKEAIDIRLDCNHQFHFDCIKQWLLKSKMCPICKEYVDLTDYQYLE